MVWYGKIAYVEQVETEPDVWESKPVEHDYFGNLLKNYKSNQEPNSINQNIKLNNQLSVVADPYLLNNFHKISYITFGGGKWRVSSVDVQPPRLILTFGEVYKDEEAAV